MADLLVVLQGSVLDIERAERIRCAAIVNLLRHQSDRVTVLKLLQLANQHTDADWWLRHNEVAISSKAFVNLLNQE